MGVLVKGLMSYGVIILNTGMRVNMNKIRVIINGEHQKLMQKAARWACSVCGTGCW